MIYMTRNVAILNCPRTVGRALPCGVLIGSLLILAGCLPEKRVVWSPDGERAAVVAADGLYLCDARGKLSGRLVPDAKRAAWLPDSRRLVVSRTQEVARWEDAAEFLAPERRKELMALAEQVRQEILTYQGDFDKFHSDALESKATGGEGIAVFVYIRDHLSQGLPEKIGAAKWEETQSLKISTQTLQVYELAGERLMPHATVFKSLDESPTLSVSPNGKHVAFLQPTPTGHHDAQLVVAATAGGAEARLVADLVAPMPNWSADGRYLAFVRTTLRLAREAGDQGQQLRLGTLSRRQVCDDKGEWVASHGSLRLKATITEENGGVARRERVVSRYASDFPEIEDLAGLILQDCHGVKCLRDGRILFSAAEIHLPSTAKDMPGRLSIFAVDPGRQPVVSRVLTREAENDLPDALNFFEVSPDERRLAIPGSKGQMAVFTLATGEVNTIVDHESEDLRTTPSWRSPEQLSFAVAAGHSCGSAGRAEIVLWSQKECQSLSRGWPAAAVKGLLIPEDKKDAAASQPAK